MFREIVRKKQALTLDECKEILKNEPRGVLSLIGDDGYPYGVPINYYYTEDDGHIYFTSTAASRGTRSMLSERATRLPSAFMTAVIATTEIGL